MFFILFLILFPLFSALVLALLRNGHIRKYFVYASSAIIIFVALGFAIQNFNNPQTIELFKDTKLIDIGMLVIELALAAYIIYVGIKWKKYYVSLLSLVQTGLIVWLELFHGESGEVGFHILSDKLTSIMVTLVAVVGCLICLYALGYMKDYHHHHTEYADRRPFFFSMLFVFLSAMFGLLFSNNLIWMFFFWEITTLASFFLIGYTKTKEARNNSFRALWMNLIGGLAFAVAIVYCADVLKVHELDGLVKAGLGGAPVLIPVAFLAFAGIVKSAQFPFSKWLLGAMVAPTPTSALLHSATMVKAGVYLLLRLAPVLHNSAAGSMVTIIGGFTFLSTSLLAISQSDAKKVLAYSTIANLGLICACAGIGAPESVWAGTLLIIFHAVSKSLMFLTVGAVENNLGSRNIEDMHGLIVKLPELALVMIIGIAGMFLAPFGMLISKWAALKSFVDASNLPVIICLVFGSAATLFYWTKWLGNLVAMLHNSERKPNTTISNEWVSLIIHAVLMIGLCVGFPIVSDRLIQPFLVDTFGKSTPTIISDGNMSIMVILLCMIAVLPFAIRFLTFFRKTKITTSYMSGINTGDDRTFYDSMGNVKKMYLSNWYMENYFGEKRLLVPSIVLSAAYVVIMLIVCISSVHPLL